MTTRVASAVLLLVGAGCNRELGHALTTGPWNIATFTVEGGDASATFEDVGFYEFTHVRERGDPLVDYSGEGRAVSVDLVTVDGVPQWLPWTNGFTFEVHDNEVFDLDVQDGVYDPDEITAETDGDAMTWTATITREGVSLAATWELKR